MTDAYDRFHRYADVGLGAEEPEIRRFTRPTEKTPVRSAKNITEVNVNTHEGSRS
jgi:hypothetical protein